MIGIMSYSEFDMLNEIHVTVLVTANSGFVYDQIKKNITKVAQETCNKEGRQAIIEMRHFLPAYGGAQTKHSDTIEIYDPSWYSRENDTHKNPPPDMLNFDNIDLTKTPTGEVVKKAEGCRRLKAAVTELYGASKEAGMLDTELQALLYTITKILDAMEARL